jgi:hypothetical protein
MFLARTDQSLLARPSKLGRYMMRALAGLSLALVLACGDATPTAADASDASDDVTPPDTRDDASSLEVHDDADGDVIAPSPGPTSQGLIRQALSGGSIDADSALIYRVFAAFDDERLPVAYRGQPGHDSLVGAELVTRYPALAPAARALVYPFTLPPPAPGSWWTLRQSGAAWPEDAPPHLLAPPPCLPPFADQAWVPLDSARFRVWYAETGDAAPPAALAAASVLEETEDYLWPLLTGLMQTEPVGDGDQPCNGGDARLDIYVLEGLGRYGSPLVMPYPVDCHRARPVFVILQVEHSRDELLATTAHELFHTLQFSFPVRGLCLDQIGGPTWLGEGTAVWAERRAYPNRGITHRFLMNALMEENPFRGLSSESAAYPYYRSFPFWHHLVERNDQPDLVRRIFESLGATENHGEAIAQVMPRGLDAEFFDFALHLLNEPPDS